MREGISPARLRTLQQQLGALRLLIIDEVSMVVARMLNLIDKRLREIFPAQAHVPFGGVYVALAGDFAQLPPVRDRPLFMPSRIGDSAQVTNGLKMIRSIVHARPSLGGTCL